MPFDSSYAVGETQELIQSELEKAGFEDIKIQEDTSGWLESGCVFSVTVDNNEKFKKGDYKKKNSSVVINISSLDRIAATDIIKTWQTENYADFKKKLEKAGFTNVSVTETETNEKNKDDLIAGLKINELDYLNEYCYIPLDAPIVINCYALKINIAMILQDLKAGITTVSLLISRSMDSIMLKPNRFLLDGPKETLLLT